MNFYGWINTVCRWQQSNKILHQLIIKSITNARTCGPQMDKAIGHLFILIIWHLWKQMTQWINGRQLVREMDVIDWLIIPCWHWKCLAGKEGRAGVEPMIQAELQSSFCKRAKCWPKSRRARRRIGTNQLPLPPEALRYCRWNSCVGQQPLHRHSPHRFAVRNPTPSRRTRNPIDQTVRESNLCVINRLILLEIEMIEAKYKPELKRCPSKATIPAKWRTASIHCKCNRVREWRHKQRPVPEESSGPKGRWADGRCWSRNRSSLRILRPANIGDRIDGANGKRSREDKWRWRRREWMWRNCTRKCSIRSLSN